MKIWLDGPDPEDELAPSTLRIGWVVPTIVYMAEEARLIVLERRDLSTMMRVATRSVSSVAARAVAPSFSWRLSVGHGGHRRP